MSDFDYNQLTQAVTAAVNAAFDARHQTTIKYDMIDLGEANRVRPQGKGLTSLFFTAGSGINPTAGCTVDRIESVEGSGIIHVVGKGFDREFHISACRSVRRATREGEPTVTAPHPSVKKPVTKTTTPVAVQPTREEVNAIRRAGAEEQDRRLRESEAASQKAQQEAQRTAVAAVTHKTKKAAEKKASEKRRPHA